MMKISFFGVTTIVGGADSVKIHGEYVPIRAEVAQLDALSAHADYAETIVWLRSFRAPDYLETAVLG